MGNRLSSTDPLDQGSTRFHALSHSTSVEIKEQTQVAVFPPCSQNKIASFSRQLSRATRARCFSLQLRIYFEMDCTPVLGFALTLGNCDNLILNENTNFSLWDLKNGCLILHGGGGTVQYLPKCVDGSVIKCTLNMGSGSVTFTVCNPGREAETKEATLPSMPAEVWPFVGVVRSGSSQVSFHIMHYDQGTEGLHDISSQVYFDAQSVCGVMKVSPHGKVVSRDSAEQGNGCAFINRVISSGLHRWSMKITCDFGASLCLGVAKHPFSLSDEYLHDPMKHVFRHTGLWVWRSYRGLLYVDGQQQQHSLEPLGWQHNSTVTVELVLNMTERTLGIIRNGKSLGIAFRDLPGTVQPVVAFYAAYEKRVELLQYFTSENLSTSPRYNTSLLARSVSESPQLPMKVTFDPTTKVGGVEISSDLMTLHRDKSQSGNSYCLLNVNCTAGQYNISFVIESDQGASTCIGLAREGLILPKQGNIYSSPNLYLYRSFQGMLYMEGKELAQKYEEFWMVGTLVGLTVDVNGGEAVVKLAVNGKEQGVAFSGIRAPLRPIVCYYASMEKRVTLIHFEHKPHSIQQRMVMQHSQPELNNLDAVSSTSSLCPLPIMARCSDASPYYGTCMICDRENRVIAYPCKHTPLCAEHILEMKKCLICDQPVTSVWNILSK